MDVELTLPKFELFSMKNARPRSDKIWRLGGGRQTTQITILIFMDQLQDIKNLEDELHL